MVRVALLDTGKALKMPEGASLVRFLQAISFITDAAQGSLERRPVLRGSPQVVGVKAGREIIAGNGKWMGPCLFDPFRPLAAHFYLPSEPRMASLGSGLGSQSDIPFIFLRMPCASALKSPMLKQDSDSSQGQESHNGPCNGTLNKSDGD